MMMNKAIGIVCFVIASLLGLVTCVSDNVERLQKLQSREGVIILTTDLHDRFVSTSVPKNYSFFVLMTAMGNQYGCKPCREFDPEFRLTAQSFQKYASGEEASRVFFGILDFKDGSEVFQKMRLNSAPVVYYHPATEGPFSSASGKPFNYDMNTNGLKAEDFARFVETSAQLKITIAKPINYQLYGLIFASIGGIAAILKMVMSRISGFFTSHRTWASISLVFIVMMVSGHMWNHIRNPPYVYPDNNNRLRYVAPGFSNQYVLETQIIAALLGVISLALISLSSVIPKYGSSEKTRALPLISMAVFIVGYAWLISLFKIKNGGYPFRILFL